MKECYRFSSHSIIMLRIVCLILTLSAFALATQTTIGEHPYHVTIESPRGHVCNGVLLSSNAILTSASCTFELRLLRLYVRAGTDRLREGGMVRDLKSLTPHKRYQPNRKDFDIAVGFLEADFQLGPNIQPVELPGLLKSPKVASSAVIVGWGVDGDVNKSETLSEVDMEISVPSKCKNVYASHFIYITERMFCAEPSAKNVNPCQGRSGSPLVAGNVLVGLCAWEQSGQKYPGIYTDVSSLKNFITDQTAVKRS